MALSGIALVTGGAGFIGSHIAAALVGQGARVRIIDDLSTGHRENIGEIGGQVDFVQASLSDGRKLVSALEDVELVFQEAPILPLPHWVEKPFDKHDATANVTF